MDIEIKDLDKGKARDVLGYEHKLFKDNVAGSDLKLALLKLMNHIRKGHNFLEALQECKITSLYKQKWSRKDFMQYQGVFVLLF